MKYRTPDRSLFVAKSTPLPTYLGIDLTNWIHTVFHANSGHDVLPTVGRRIVALTQHLQPKMVVLCLDARSFRYGIYPAYKIKRHHGHVEGLHEALRDAADDLGNLGVIVKAHGFEADDCLAALAHEAMARGYGAVLASPDKDINQCLVADRVSIIRKFHLLGNTATNIEWMTPTVLHQQYGLTPKQWIDYQTVVGDSGDGIPGCKGWGKDTMLPILQQWGSLDAVYDHIDEVQVGEGRRRTLLQFRDDGLAVMRQLVTLRTDVEEIKRIFVSRRRIGGLTNA